MPLPLTPPVQPMLATSADAIPTTSDLLFEPKWDGYRCLVFRDGSEVVLQSRGGKPLNRYFPEVEAALRGSALPDRVVLDGELVVSLDGRLDFDALTERIHPAASRVALLSERTPAGFVAFDLLALGDEVLLDRPTSDRRAALEDVITPSGALHLTPCTGDVELARRWFGLFEGAGLDGVVGKAAGGAYLPGKRAMVKVKHARTAECVVAGLRWHKDTEPGTAVGSLLLGLHDDAGVLHHVGVVGSFKAAERRSLAEELTPLITDGEHPWVGHSDERRTPGGTNRWRKESDWTPLTPERVLEVSYSQTEGAAPARLRHNGQFRRWRPDRDAASCRYDQLDQPARYDLAAVLRGEVRKAR
ncbi:ATP-dependent DNA ligase [Actinosynnema pretiosum subsp. pretiosum]|uniref:DNA ligase (ATP) n=1 Tax=Actinosynnema pretiosum subsp. pretiosum TaxID=103721 RepID=A0AA45LBQ1_9PSEU|nr:ATP-dependent DNA ligase [Actinosynnema pretiosum subsp. pretiosum]QUF06800.1 ATP-dependent DNA ligase [Actinosynnema pretiosum subsp. pretiosum]